MVYYADYEALEFNNKEAEKEGIYPYYLDSSFSDTSLCPLVLKASNAKGKEVYSSDCYSGNISFIHMMKSLIRKHPKELHNKVIFIWFHNVKYDHRIIAHELEYNKFKQTFDSEEIEYRADKKIIVGEQDKTYSIIGRSLSQYIGVNIYFNGFKFLVRDSMSILNNSQDKILKKWGMESKIEVDWDNINIKNLKEKMQLIKDRCQYDVESISLCVEDFKNTIYTNFHGRGSTAASISLDCLLHDLCVRSGSLKPSHEEKKELFKEYYPPINGEAKEICDALYGGGICTVNKLHQGKELKNLQMLDINSSYPNSMRLELPYGLPREINDFKKTGYSEYIVYISFVHNGIPFQRCNSEKYACDIIGIECEKSRYNRSSFPNEYSGYLAINSIDLETLIKYATIKELLFIKGYTYYTDKRIAHYIETLYDMRKKSEGAVKEAIKLLLNGLYGKYAQDRSGLIVYYNSLKESFKVQAIDKNRFYKPLAAAVTAYSRQNWVNTIYMMGENFVYGDTDSAYFINPDKVINKLMKQGIIDDNELGKWGLDKDYGSIIKRGKFLSKKNYILELPEDRNKNKYKNKYKVTCVGLSARYHDQVTFENFEINSEPYKIQKMVNIYGGKAMRNTEFKIKERAVIY